MSDAYSTLESIWARYLEGERSNLEMEMLALLSSQGIRVRQRDGDLKQITVSKATTVESGFVIGLRYIKLDGTCTEDHFSLEKDGVIRPYYKGRLEDKWAEYRGTHKQEVNFDRAFDVHDPITLVNTITFIKTSS
jgi:hypothetical protein